MGSTIVYVHGRSDDDPEQHWRNALEDATRRGQYGSLEERGLSVVAPSWLDILGRQHPTKDDPPPETYTPADRDDLIVAKRRYLSRTASLERATRMHARAAPATLGDVVTDALADEWVAHFMDDVRAFCTVSAMRSAAIRRVLASLPSKGEIILIGHSLGSLVAVDLLYVLPAELQVAALITVGSPLAHPSLGRHLRRVEQRFPYDAVGAWLNVVGTGDPICGFRGAARLFPAALDAFISTGAPAPGLAAHSASRYLGHQVITQTFDWVYERQHPTRAEGRDLEAQIPEDKLPLFIGLQYARHIEWQLKAGSDQRTRFANARRAVIADLRLRETDPAIARTLGADNAHRLTERVNPDQALALLLELAMSNPIQPYEVKYEGGEEEKALIGIATDLGLNATWPRIVLEAEKRAREAHGAPHKWARRGVWALGAAVLAAVAVTAPYLVLAVAPEGVGGAAALVGGLAALGPGGMAGGLGTLGLAGGLAGGAVGAGIASISAEAVEETVIGLQALGFAAYTVGELELASTMWAWLVDMEEQAAQLSSRLTGLSDSGSIVRKDAEKKLDAIRKALDWLRDNGVGPPLLPPGNHED